MAYNPDKEFNKNLANFSFGETFAKSYTFYVNPRFEIEKQVTLVVWVIEDIIVAKPLMSQDPQFAQELANNFSGLQRQTDGTFKPFDLAGNKAISAALFNLPKTNPKNGNQLKDSSRWGFKVDIDSTKPNCDFNLPSYYSLQERFDKGEEKELSKPTSLDAYIDYALYTAGTFYKGAIYEVPLTGEVDLPKFKLPENDVKFTQTPSPPEPEKPSNESQVENTTIVETKKITGDFKFNVETSGAFIIVGSSSIPDSKLTIITDEKEWTFDSQSTSNEELDEEYAETDVQISPEVEAQIEESKLDSIGQELLKNIDPDKELKKSEESDSTGKDSVNKNNANDTNPQNLNTVAVGKVKKMLEIAVGEIGYKETRNEDLKPEPKKDTKYGVYWGMNGHHYCGMFVNWCGEQAGMKKAKKNGDPGIPDSIYCPNGVSVFKSAGLYVSNGSNKAERKASKVIPEPGDVVYFSWNFDNMANHVGIVEKDLGDGTVQCLEGNTSLKGGTANARGSGVNRKVRDKVSILGYGKTSKWHPDNITAYTGPVRKPKA